MKRSTQSLAVLGLSALSLATLASVSHATAVAPITFNTQGEFTVAFDASKLTPDPAGQPGTLDFIFSPAPGQPAPAMVTLGDLYFSQDWNASVSDFQQAQYTGQANLNLNFADLFAPKGGPYQSTFTFENVDSTGNPAVAGVEFPVETVGSTGGFNLTYADPPGTDPSTFSFLIGNTSLFSASIAPGGQATILSEAPGTSVTATPNTGTLPVIGPNALNPTVPEPSSLALLGLGALPLLAVARRRRAARA